jgi:hypothetical protein
MIYQLEIDAAKEKQLIGFLKQLDFVTVTRIKKSSGKKTAHNTPSVNLDDYNKDIDEAMAEIARGEGVSHKKVTKMAQNW